MSPPRSCSPSADRDGEVPLPRFRSAVARARVQARAPLACSPRSYAPRSVAQSATRCASGSAAPTPIIPGASPSKHHFASFEARGVTEPARFEYPYVGPHQRARATTRTCRAVVARLTLALLAIAITLAQPMLTHRALAMMRTDDATHGSASVVHHDGSPSPRADGGDRGGSRQRSQ